MDNRQIVSGSRDKTIKLWNTLAECKYTIQDDGHSDWVSCVRFSPNHANPIIVSAGWDKVVKVGKSKIGNAIVVAYKNQKDENLISENIMNDTFFFADMGLIEKFNKLRDNA